MDMAMARRQRHGRKLFERVKERAIQQLMRNGLALVGGDPRPMTRRAAMAFVEDVQPDDFLDKVGPEHEEIFTLLDDNSPGIITRIRKWFDDHPNAMFLIKIFLMLTMFLNKPPESDPHGPQT